MNEVEPALAATRRQRRGGHELRAAILAAASDVFFEAGYAGASLESVINRVGGSKRAIYSHFGGKKELFAALVTDASSRALATLAPEEIATHDLQETLLAFGRRVTEVVMSPLTVALYRVVVAEGIRFPDLAHTFFEAGPGRASARLAVVLEEFRGRGEIKVGDTRRAAERFIGMLRDDLHLRVLLGLRPPPSAAEIKRSVRQAVHIFLQGCQTNAKKTAQRKRVRARPSRK